VKDSAGLGGTQPREAARRGGSRPGRRPGDGRTRDAILAAARDEFARLGFDRATIRRIAAAADVDPALVLHYFSSKEKLFAAALQIPVEPGAVLRRVMAHDTADMGAAVVRTFLEAWEPPESRSPLVAMVRSAMTNETAMALVREYLGRRVFGPITQALGAPDAELRATLMGSQFIGLAMMRYIARIEPLASASVDQIVAAIGPTMQRYLTGDLDPRTSAES
jgi:AcrR family transcriptional regulator